MFVDRRQGAPAAASCRSIDRLTIAAAFRLNFIHAVKRRGFIEGSPTVSPVRGLTRDRVDGLVAAEDFPRLGNLVAIHPCGHERPAAAHALGVEMRLALVNARFGHRSDDPARGRADGSASRRANRGGNQPACRDDRPDPGDRQHAEPGQKTAGAADDRADPGARARVRAGIAAVLVDIAAVGVVGDDADVGARNPGRLKRVHCRFCRSVAIVKSCYRRGHSVSFPVAWLGRGYLVTTLPWKSSATLDVAPPLLALPRHTPSWSFIRPDTLPKPAASMRDFACASVKLFAPAAGASALVVDGVATAGVWAFGLAGGPL